jgi:hypothetical protein
VKRLLRINRGEQEPSRITYGKLEQTTEAAFEELERTEAEPKVIISEHITLNRSARREDVEKWSTKYITDPGGLEKEGQ